MTPRLMAILNITPDSFSDGGRLASVEEAIAQAGRAIAAGAAILDVGGESTRPGALEVPADEEIHRVVPVIDALHRTYPEVPVSIDTRKAAVAEAAVRAGARIINDVSGLRFDPTLAAVAARYGTDLILMHSIGTPETMQRDPHYPEGVTVAVRRFLERQAEAAMAAGVARERIIIDPGFGFGKTVDHNVQLLHYIGALKTTGFPVLVGLSRKSFLTLGDPSIPPDRREALTAAAHTIALQQGADILRVHDIKTHASVLRLISRFLSVEDAAYCGDSSGTAGARLGGPAGSDPACRE